MDLNDDDVDLVDPDTLLDEQDLVKPDPESLRGKTDFTNFLNSDLKCYNILCCQSTFTTVADTY